MGNANRCNKCYGTRNLQGSKCTKCINYEQKISLQQQIERKFTKYEIASDSLTDDAVSNMDELLNAETTKVIEAITTDFNDNQLKNETIKIEELWRIIFEYIGTNYMVYNFGTMSDVNALFNILYQHCKGKGENRRKLYFIKMSKDNIDSFMQKSVKTDPRKEDHNDKIIEFIDNFKHNKQMNRYLHFLGIDINVDNIEQCLSLNDVIFWKSNDYSWSACKYHKGKGPQSPVSRSYLFVKSKNPNIGMYGFMIWRRRGMGK